MSIALLLVITLVVVKISHWLYRWSNPKCNGKLPPGSMGYPIIGQTIDFFKPHGFYEILPFITKGKLRYGPLFRTHLLGSKTVVSTEPDVNFEILRQENKSFRLSYPGGLVKTLGKDNILLREGNFHKHIKHITREVLGSEGLKQRMIKDMDRITHEHLRAKASNGILDVHETVSSLIVEHMTSKMISDLKPETQRKLMTTIKTFSLNWFMSSFFSLSTWKDLYIILMARRDGLKVIKDVFAKRKNSSEKYGDLLDTLLKELEKEGSLWTQHSSPHLLFLIPFASHDSTSKATCLAVKFLCQNPKAVAELKREHEAILKSRDDKQSGISWEEYRDKMSFTNMVINETLRLTNFVPIFFRKAVVDVEIKGYTIPAGWIVVIAPQVVHFDPEIYENPFEFNPWRWEGKKLKSTQFMVFGGGLRQCVGAGFARLQMAVFLHHLVTYYDFSMAQDCEVIRQPGLNFLKDLTINISESTK